MPPELVDTDAEYDADEFEGVVVPTRRRAPLFDRGARAGQDEDEPAGATAPMEPTEELFAVLYSSDPFDLEDDEEELAATRHARRREPRRERAVRSVSARPQRGSSECV